MWLLGVNIESPFPAQNKEARRGMTNFYGAVESRFAEGGGVNLYWFTSQPI